MSHLIFKTACVAAGLAVAVLATSSAQAAQPLNVKQKAELARDMANNREAKAKFLAPPKTTAQALSKRRKLADGSFESFELAEDTYNYLGAVKDAKGVMHVRDVNPDAPVSIAVEATDEK